MISTRILAFLTAIPVSVGMLGAMPAAAETDGENGENNTVASAEEVTLNTAVTGSLSSEDDLDYYTFTLTEDGAVSFSLSHETSQFYSSNYWTFTLTDSQSSIIHTYGLGGQQLSAETDVQGLKAGTYYLYVEKPSSFYSNENYTFTTNFTASANAQDAYEAEPNNSIIGANTIEVGTPYSGNTHNSGDADYYQFTLAEDAAISTTFTHPKQTYGSNYWIISLKDETDATIQSWGIGGTNTTTTTSAQGLKAGTYYFKVEGASPSSFFSADTYTFTLNTVTDKNYEAEWNNTTADANEIALNTDYIGSIQDSADADYYALTLTEDGSLAVRFAITEQSYSSSYWTISLLKEDGTEITEWEKGGSITLANFQSTGLSAGKYFIKVKDASHQTASAYTLQAVFTASTSEVPYEAEPNNDAETADTLTAGTAITGNLHTESDLDYYKLHLDENGLVQLTFTHPEQDYSSGYWSFTLMYPDGTALTTWTSAGNSLTSQTQKIGLRAGDYYVKVSAANYHSTDSYTLLAAVDTTTLAEAESDDTAADANAIPVATACTGNLHNKNDVDVYQFTLDSTSNVSVTFTHPEQEYSSGYWNISITDDSGEALTSLTSKGGIFTADTDELQLSSGTYYVKVSADSHHSYDNYTLTVNAAEQAYTLGDVDADGDVDSNDIYYILLSVAYKGAGLSENQLSGTQFLAADVDKDGVLTTDDVYYVMYYSALSGAGYAPEWSDIIK